MERDKDGRRGGVKLENKWREPFCYTFLLQLPKPGKRPWQCVNNIRKKTLVMGRRPKWRILSLTLVISCPCNLLTGICSHEESGCKELSVLCILVPCFCYYYYSFKLLALKVISVALESWLLTRGSKYSDVTWKLFVFLENWSPRRGGRNQRFHCIFIYTLALHYDLQC